MDAGLHWMDIKILPHGGSNPMQVTGQQKAYPQRALNPNDFTIKVGEAIKSGAVKTGGKAIYVFRVLGENRVIAALDGGLLGATEAVNEVAGHVVDLTTTPCRSYETWAEQVVGVDPSLTKAVKHGDIGDKGRIVWFHASVSSKGLSQQQLLDAWKREVEYAFPKRVTGEMKLDLYKFVGRSEVAAIFRTENIDEIDNNVWKLPLYVEHGDKIERFVKSLDFL